jgi:DAK2 domain
MDQIITFLRIFLFCCAWKLVRRLSRLKYPFKHVCQNVLKKAATVAESGAERTASMTARAGRASYVAKDKVSRYRG